MVSRSGNHVPSSSDSLRLWLGTVQAKSASLATSEAKVIDLLLADPLFVGTSTTAHVAARAGVSAPTVVRAARAIGYGGFTELKLEIARARGTTDFFAPPLALGADAGVRTIVEASAQSGTDALAALRGAIDTAQVEKAVEAVRSAQQMIAYGAGPSATVAADAVFRFRALGVRTAGIVDHESAMIAAHLLHPGDVLAVVSSTGRTATTLAVADAASGSGASVIAITNHHDTPLTDLADIALVVGGAPLSTQMAASSSRLAHLVVVDVLTAALALRDPDRVTRAERAGIDLPDMA